MSFQIGALFLFVGAMLAAGAVALGGAGWTLAWPAASFLVVTAGYFGVGAGVLGKRPDGRIPLWSRVFHAPYFGIIWGYWHLRRRYGGEACWGEVAPGVFVGRRCYARELPDGVALVVDMTAELEVADCIRAAGTRYRCVPTLDGSVPPEREFREIVAEIAAADGPVYVHCAAGHGRSATAAAAALVARGIASDVDAALALMRRARPTVYMRRRQRSMALRASTPSRA